MTTRRSLLPVLALVAALLLPTATAAAKDRGFKGVVKHIESHYRVKRKRIPFLGLAGLAVRIIRPAGVKSFKLAIFENQDFVRGADDTAFEQGVREALAQKWKPLVRVRSRRDSNPERIYVYSKEAGKDLQVIALTMEARQAVVVEAKVNPQAMMKFMENPRILGFSLAGRTGSGTLAGGPSGVLTGRSISQPSSSDRGSSSLSTLAADSNPQPSSLTGLPRQPDQPPAKLEAASRPALRAPSRETTDPALEPDLGTPPNPNEVPRPADRETIRLETRLVNLNVKATDRAGRAISDLKKEEFVVLEDGVEQQIAYFAPVSARVNLVLLLDLSGSTKEKRKVMVQAAKEFIDALGPEDRIAIAAFTREFRLISDFTTNRKLLKERVEKINKISGGTAYYDAMWKTLDLLAELKEPRKALVVLTDGEDNSINSEHYTTQRTFDELLGRVSEEDVTIYPIYLRPERETGFRRGIGSGLSILIGQSIANSRLRLSDIARAQLQAVAEQSAGVVFNADHERDLEGVYQRVAAELHLLYSLAYYPSSTEGKSGFRQLSVKTSREGTMARTRRGYYVKSPRE
jgi:VWFA-related protein